MSLAFCYHDFGEQSRYVGMESDIIFRTVKYLKDHNYFGMPEDQVYVMMQDCIPAVRNIQGEIACDNEGHIIRKPHGHGDIHFCLYRVFL